MGASSLFSIDDMLGVLIFRIQDKYFTISLDQFSAVINPRDITSASLTFSPSEKVIKYNGEIITLIEFNRFYDLELTPDNQFSQILALEVGKRKLAFYVDSVEEIISFNRYIRDTVKIMPVYGKPNVACEMLLDGKSFMIPDLESIGALVAM